MLGERVQSVGGAVVDRVVGLQELLRFAGQCLKRVLRPRTYLPVVRDLIVLQIYFTAVEILLAFVLVSMFFGSIFVGLFLQILKSLGLAEYLGDIMVGLVLSELGPLVIVFWLALRTSAAINAEIAVMKVHREIAALRLYGIDELSYLYVPRILSVMITCVLLTGLFSIIVTLSGMVFAHTLFDMGWRGYTTMIINSLGPFDLLLILLKSAVFGFFLAVIPIFYGANATFEKTSIPVSVLNGMTRVFSAIVLVELVSLLPKYI